MASSASDGPSTSAATKAPLELHSLSLKSSSKKILKTPKLLLIAFEVSLKETLNIN